MSVVYNGRLVRTSVYYVYVYVKTELLPSEIRVVGCVGQLRSKARVSHTVYVRAIENEAETNLTTTGKILWKRNNLNYDKFPFFE